MFADRDSVPTDTPDTDSTPAHLAAYTPVKLVRRANGWTAERQRTFLTVLAETGSISEACAKAGVSSRSAYRLRQRPDATSFARAWEQALKLATVRLMTIAFERATRGTVKEYWRGGELVAETRAPSERSLLFLLGHLLPAGAPGERWAGCDAMVAQCTARFPAALDELSDHDVEMVPIETRDFFPQKPGDPREDW